MNHVVAIRFDYDKSVAAFYGEGAVRISFQGFSGSGSSPLGTRTVESFSPGSFVIGAMASLFDSAGYAHVEDLADAGGIVAIVLKMLGPHWSIANLRTWIIVS